MVERFKCECGNEEFIPWPMYSKDYQSARIKCTKCEKIWGLPKVINGSKYEDGD